MLKSFLDRRILLRSIFTLVVLICSAYTSFSQIKITGKIIAENKSPLEFAEVTILNKDSMGIKSELANEDGTFQISIQPGRYTLQIRQFSKSFFSRVIDSQTDVDLGEIQVSNTLHELSAVNVEVKSKLIERRADRVVFNVENAINAAGGDALEALKITPGVRVQNDAISMIGKSNLAVMIDDKLIQLSGDDLINYLKSIPADMIRSIEIMSTPPAKYDAAGNSGFVNIKLKKSRRDSWNASLSSTYLQRMHGSGSTFGNFNFNKNKFSFSASAFYTKGVFYKTEDDYSYFKEGLWHTHSTLNFHYNRFNTNVNLDYQLTSRWTIGSQIMMNMGSNFFTNNPYSYVYDYETGEKIRSLENVSPSYINPGLKSINLYNEFKLDTIGKKLTVNLDYFNYKNSDRKQYEGVSTITNPYVVQYFKGINKNEQDITNLSGKLDMDYPLKWINLSFGGKVSNSVAKHNISFYNSGVVDQVPADPELNRTLFSYTENVEALYLSGNKSINSKWESQLGLRMEATQIKTFSQNLDQRNERNYVKFFPTAYITYTANENASLTFNYSRRIRRPGFYDLNPNAYFLNPFQVIEGNPFLQPAFIDNAELVHAYKKLESKLYFSNEKNMFAQLPLADSTVSFIHYINENYYSTRRWGISETYVFDKFNWWTSTNELDVNYALIVSHAPSAQGRKGFNSRVSTKNDFNLNSSKTLLFNVSYWYAFRGVDGIFIILPQSNLSLAVQYLMLDKNLRMSLRVTDVFRTELDRMQTSVNGVYQDGTYYHDSQSLQLSVSYKFGNNKLKEKRRETGNQEEKNRAGG